MPREYLGVGLSPIRDKGESHSRMEHTRRAERREVMTRQTTPFQLTAEENRADHSLNVIVLQKSILEAVLASARLEGMEEAAKIAADYEAVAYQSGNLPINDPNECAAQTAREIAALIRAELAGGKDE